MTAFSEDVWFENGLRDATPDFVMNPLRTNANKEGTLADFSFLPTSSADPFDRFYKLAPGGRWFRQRSTGVYERTKSRSAKLRLQKALNTVFARPE